MSVMATRDVRALGRRESQVLRLVGSGLTTWEIADELGVSISTVVKYLMGSFRKLEIHDRHEASRYATEHQLLTDE